MIDKLFEVRQKYKDENKDVMHVLVKLIMNSLYGEQIRKDNEESYECKSEAWMMTEYDERVLDYQKNNHVNYIVKMKDDDGLEDEVKKVKVKPLHLGAFVLSYSKRNMNNFIHAIDGFYTNDVYYTDTDSLYSENKHWDNLDKARLVWKNRLQGRIDYKDGGIWYGLFLAPKIEIFGDFWTLRETFSAFWRKLSVSGVKTAFYVSRETFRGKVFFYRDFFFHKIIFRQGGNFSALWRIYLAWLSKLHHTCPEEEF